MLTFRRFLHLGLSTVVLLASFSAAMAQTVDADEAKALLEQGVKEFDALKFAQAKQTFLKLDDSKLTDDDKKILDDYLIRVDPAIRKQQSAQEAYDNGVEALKNNDLSKAKECFAQAASSEFVSPKTRQDAGEQLAAVDRRIEAAAAAGKDQPETAPSLPTIIVPAVTLESGVAETSTATQPSVAPPRQILAELEQRRAKALQLVASGKTALLNSEPEQAVMYFERALALMPELEEAKQQLRIARGITGTGAGSILSRAEQRRKVLVQSAKVDFEKAMKRSHEALAAEESESSFTSATNAARVAKDVLETEKSLFPATEYREMLRQVNRQMEWIQDRREAWDKRRAQQKIEAIQQAEQIRREKTRRELAREIETLTRHARTLTSEHRYSEAIEVLDRILKLDSKNLWARDRRELLQQFVMLREEGELDRTRSIEEQKVLVNLRESEIPWYELLKFPSDWRELTIRRAGAGAAVRAEPEINRRVRAVLNSPSPKLDFTEIAFDDVVKFIVNVSGVNVFVKWSALNAVGIDKSTPVNVHLAGVTYKKALDVILDDVGGMNELGYVVDNGVITISTKDDLSGAAYRRTQVYDIRDLIVRVPNFIAPRIELSGATTGTEGDTDSGDGGLFGGDDDDEGDRAEEGTPSKAELINRIMTLITTTIDPNSWAPVGEVGSIQELGGQLVVTQTDENHTALLDLINKLREARALQIAIEARFISVDTGFLNSIGIDLNLYFNLGSRLGGGGYVTDPYTGAFVPAMGPSGWAGKPGNSKFTPMGFIQNKSFGNMIGVETGVPNGIGTFFAAGAAPTLDIRGTFLDDIQVDFIVQATQAHQTTRSLTAPRLTLFNGQRAYVAIAQEQAYVADLTPKVAENAIAYDITVGYVPTGTVLDVEATVSADRRYVTMTVRPQVSTLNGFTQYVISGELDPTGNATSGVGFVQLPNVTIQDIQTTVSVPDGGTLLLGGQKRAGEIEREEGVPLLSKIPILNRFFIKRGKLRDEQTLLIFIKPTIIIEREQELRQFPSSI